MKLKSPYIQTLLFTFTSNRITLPLSFHLSSSSSSLSSSFMIQRTTLYNPYFSTSIMTYPSSSSSSSSSYHPSTTSSTKSKDPYLPTMIVFDLDDCLWSPEMYTLSNKPSIPIQGNLNPNHANVAATATAAAADEDYENSTLGDSVEEIGIVGMGVPPQGRPIVQLFDDARTVLRLLKQESKYHSIILALASSSEEPTFSYSCLQGIDIFPHVKMISLFTYHEIGRTGHLSSRKTTHFKTLHEKSGIPFEEMLFFDDCNWGDHCTDVTTTLGVVSQRTPNGLTLNEFYIALEKYKKVVEQRSISLERNSL